MPYFVKKTELCRKLVSNGEVDKLNRKDNFVSFSLGDSTSRFNTINEIHEELLKKYPSQDIVTYYESKPFKEMLIVKDGEVLNYKSLGEFWVDVPNSCWRDLITEDDLLNLIIKCANCGQPHMIDKLIEDEIYYSIENRTAISFNVKKRDMLEPCCNYPNLVWNVIL